LGAVAATGLLWGQTFYGGIRGKVVDASGAAIPEAKITLVDQGIGVSRTTVSNAEGVYAFSALSPATYKISIEKQGFSRVERSDIGVGTQSAVVADFTMEVGAVTQTLEVAGDTSVLETADASQGALLSVKMLTDLPNLGRNTWLTGQLAPSVVWVGAQKNTTMHDQSCSAQVVIAGGPIRSNNYLIDGIPITDARNRATIVPTLEAVQEVKMMVQTYDAEMGRTGGGVFNAYLKSGANEVHGSGFEYTRPVVMFAAGYAVPGLWGLVRRACLDTTRLQRQEQDLLLYGR
jgi:trimeric autotransporter adhesin